jgi:uncharacterized protein YxeA
MKSEIKVILVVFLSLLGVSVYTYRGDSDGAIEKYTQSTKTQKEKDEDFERFGRNRGQCKDYYSFERENGVKSGEEIRDMCDLVSWDEELNW